jgi:Domain of unknown function (DUF4303)
LELHPKITESYYLRLEATLTHDWTLALIEFASSKDNVDVYVVTVQFDGSHSDALLAVNTEQGFERIAARYPDNSPDQLRRHGEARWNPAEFTHFDIAPSSPVINELREQFLTYLDNCTDEEIEAHSARIAQAMVKVLEQISLVFAELRRTPDFISFVWPMAASESEIINYTRLTVPASVFERLFPEIRETEQFMAGIAERSASEQAAFWANALRDIVLVSSTPSAKTLRTLGVTEDDAIQALVDVGAASIPELVRIAEEHGMAEEWNERDSDEWKRLGARTHNGELASSALLALEDLGDGPDDIIERLQTLLQNVHDRDRTRALAGLNGQLAARALHALRPQVFPEAEFSDKTNHLLNPADFGVT